MVILQPSALPSAIPTNHKLGLYTPWSIKNMPLLFLADRTIG